MAQKFQLEESVLFIYGGRLKKGKVVLYREELLEEGSIEVSYRVQCDEGGLLFYRDEWELARTELELANNILESYGFSNELRFRPVCEKCTRLMTETYQPL